MEKITEEVLERISMQMSTSHTSNTKGSKYRCEKCKDDEMIITFKDGVPYATPCECAEVRRYEQILRQSGISEAFRSKGLKNYQTDNQARTDAKELAKEYILTFTGTQSIAFLGQPGAGKTHLTLAIANNLMTKNIGVRYFQYRETLPMIKQTVTDRLEYQKELNKYKTAKVLLVDDLYKFAVNDYGRVNDADMRIMFEIINYRYLNQLPIILSSEYNSKQLLGFDDATGSRLIEMCKPNIYTFEGSELNYRITG